MEHFLKWQDRFYSSYCSRGERLKPKTELNSKDRWGFAASGQSEGVSGWKTMKWNLIRYQSRQLGSDLLFS